jgi:hypothetical protein
MICVVGAPRCGTTSLSTYLADHPDIRFSCVKEPHFFSRVDLAGATAEELRQRVEEDYLDRFFPDRSEDERILAEGSVSYLYAPERMEAILRLWPDAQFVIALRDPMSMLPSLHLRQLCNGDEAEPDFERAWALAPERRQGRWIPASCFEPRCLEYDEIARLGHWVERFIAAVGPERCFISVFDDLVADPEAVYRRLLDFLDLPYHPRRDFAAKRASRGYRFGGLQRLLKRPPAPARAMLSGATMRRRTNISIAEAGPVLRLVLKARKKILDLNSRPANPEAISPSLRARIRAQLRDDIERLSELVGRNLDHWLDGEGEASNDDARGLRDPERGLDPSPQPLQPVFDVRDLARVSAMQSGTRYGGHCG